MNKEEAIRILRGDVLGTNEQTHEAVFMAIKVLKAEPKRGRWERHILKNANVPWGYDCSACGVWFVVGDDTVKKYYYCPNCGARMSDECAD